MSHAEFVQACEAQGVALHPRLVSEAWDSFSVSWIVRSILRNEESLATGGLLDPAFCDGPLSSHMVSLINTSQQPDSSFSPRFPIAPRRGVGACQDAEGYFGNWLKGLEAGENVGGRIVVGPDGQALAIEKATGYKSTGFGDPSTLLLRGVAVGKGIRLLPGSMVYMDVLAQETDDTNVVRSNRVKGMALLRFSGFTLSDAEWLEYIGPSPARNEYMNLERAQKIVQNFLAQRPRWWEALFGSSQRPTDMVSSNQKVNKNK